MGRAPLLGHDINLARDPLGRILKMKCCGAEQKTSGLVICPYAGGYVFIHEPFASNICVFVFETKYIYIQYVYNVYIPLCMEK